MQEVRLLFTAKAGGDARLQLLLLRVGRQQIAQRHAAVAEQAEMQIADGGDAQTVAAGAEILLVGHDQADFALIVRMAEHLRRAIAAVAQLALPALHD